VVAAEGDEAGDDLGALRDWLFGGRVGGAAVEERVVARLNLLQSIGVVVAGVL
jgi:hypothetical protein